MCAGARPRVRRQGLGEWRCRTPAHGAAARSRAERLLLEHQRQQQGGRGHAAGVGRGHRRGLRGAGGACARRCGCNLCGGAAGAAAALACAWLHSRLHVHAPSTHCRLAADALTTGAGLLRGRGQHPVVGGGNSGAGPAAGAGLRAAGGSGRCSLCPAPAHLQRGGAGGAAYQRQRGGQQGGFWGQAGFAAPHRAAHRPGADDAGCFPVAGPGAGCEGCEGDGWLGLRREREAAGVGEVETGCARWLAYMPSWRQQRVCVCVCAIQGKDARLVPMR